MNRTPPTDSQDASNNTEFFLHAVPLQQERTIVRSAILIIVLAVISFLITLFNLPDAVSTQHVILHTGLALPILLGIAAIIDGLRGHKNRAAWLIVAGFLGEVFVMTLMIPNAYISLSLTAFIVVLLFSNRAMDQRGVQWAIMAAALIYLGSRLAAYVLPNVRLESQLLGDGANIVGYFLVLVLGVLALRMFRLFSLTIKLTLVILVVTVALAILIGAYTVSSTSLALQQSVGSNLANLARTQAQATGDLLNAQLSSLTSFGLGDVVQRSVIASNNAYGGDPEAIDRLLSERDQEWRQAVAKANDTNALVRSRMVSVVSRDLQEFVRVFPAYSEVMLTDVHGGLVGASRITNDYDQSDEDWWLAVANSPVRTASVSAPYYDADSRGYVIRIAVPVRDRSSGKMLGIIGSTYRVNSLFGQLSQTRIGETGEPDLYFPGASPTILHGDGVQEPGEVFHANLEAYGEALYREMDYNGVMALVSRAPVVSTTGDKEIERLGWIIMAHQDTEEAYAPVQTQVSAISLIVAILICLTSALALVMAQFVTGPVARLTKTAENVRAGDLSATAVIESSDEIGLLAATFNDMTRQLSQTLAGLEQRVEERTRELSLSGEVGRDLSQERRLGQLVQSAVDRIQQAFDLYYVQMYLVDPARQDLVLQAGSGRVGQELTQKSHRLAIGPGSINGSAAATRQPVLVGNTADSDLFRPNLLLPDTRSELSVPLLVGDRVVGVLDMQSRTAGALTRDSLPAFQALASQLAVAVENAALFAQAESARRQMEAQMQMQARSGWEDYLDGIRRQERLGFRYDRDRQVAVPWTGELSAETPDGDAAGQLTAPILVTGAPVGAISLQRADGAGWTPQEKNLIRVVADQVARQIEGLRLFAQAQQYRDEAEHAVRRMTRQGWEEYLAEAQAQELGFVYDQNRVAAAEPAAPAPDALTAPLLIQDVPVGELAVEGLNPDDTEALDLLHTITSRLSEHLDGIRLLEQTQSALVQVEQSQESLRRHEENLQKQSAALGELTRSEAISQGNLEEALKEICVSAANVMEVSRVSVWLTNDASRTSVRRVVAYDRDARRHDLSDVRLHRQDYPAHFAILEQGQVLVADDARTHPATCELTETHLKPLGISSMLEVPIRFGGQVIGMIVIEHTGPQRHWLAEDMSFGNSLCDIATLAFEANARRARALQEQRIREVTAQVISGADVQSVMRRAVEQVGRVLGAPAYIYVGQTNGQPANGGSAHPAEDTAQAEPAA